MGLPQHLQPFLWSYDLSKMDKNRDARVIITHVLNYGNNTAVSWLFSNYDRDAIREVLLHPQRGMWYREKLRRWLGFFNLMIDPLEFESAIVELTPRIKLHEAFFQRKGLLNGKIFPPRLKQ